MPGEAAVKILRETPDSAAITLLEGALDLAFAGKPRPSGLYNYLQSPRLNGRVCCIFFYGRSGSFFAQSFFDKGRHPQLVCVNPAAITNLDETLVVHILAQYARQPILTFDLAKEICSAILGQCQCLLFGHPERREFDDYQAPRDLVVCFLLATLMIVGPPALTFENILKLVMLSDALARGQPIDFTRPLAFMWQAHSPSTERKRRLAAALPQRMFVTVVRFPEKALDSHLIHHAFESISPPSVSLLPRLLFEPMAYQSALSSNGANDDDQIIRFEDLHHHPNVVVKAWLEALAVDPLPNLGRSDFMMQVGGREVRGARQLTPAEFTCRLLNYYDRLKIRYLLQEEYRAWGYSGLCDPSLEGSLQAFHADPVAQASGFHAQSILANMEVGFNPDLVPEADLPAYLYLTGLETRKEYKDLNELFAAERERRDRGVRVPSLLYCLEALNAP